LQSIVEYPPRLGADTLGVKETVDEAMKKPMSKGSDESAPLIGLGGAATQGERGYPHGRWRNA